MADEYYIFCEENNYDFNYCANYIQNQQQQQQQQPQQSYADDFLAGQQQEMVNEMGLQERLQHNRKCFHQFAESIGSLKDVKPNVKDTIIAKHCPSDFPSFPELSKIYEKDVQKMQVTKTLKKNWNEDDTLILIWCVMKYCSHINMESYKQLTEGDWQFVANMVPGKDKESCRFKWLKMCKVNIQDEPWTKEENEILPSIVGQVEEKGKKDWVEVSSQLFYETGQKIYRTPKQCREHFNNYHDPEIKKGSWSQEEDLELLKYAQELGKKWSIIAKKLSGRTENAVKNRFHAIFRKHLEKAEARKMEGLNEEEAEIYESEEVSSENQNTPGNVMNSNNNLNSMGNATGNENEVSKESMKEMKLINRLIKNIENKLKINSSECYSSDNNSVYSDSGKNSKIFTKQKHKMMQFLHKNYESMSSDDDSSKTSPRTAQSTQKSIFGKAYGDQIKCKQDNDEILEDAAPNSNIPSINNQLQQQQQKNQIGQISLEKQDQQQQQQFLNQQQQKDSNNLQQQRQPLPKSNQLPYQQNNLTQSFQTGMQQQPQGQGQASLSNIPSNVIPQTGSQNFDFFNYQIFLGGQPNQQKNDSIEDFGNNSYPDLLPNQQGSQPQNSNSQQGFLIQKIPSLEHIDMKQPEEVKLKLMNSSDLVMNETDQYSYAIVNLTKNELYLALPAQNQNIQKLFAQQSSQQFKTIPLLSKPAAQGSEVSAIDPLLTPQIQSQNDSSSAAASKISFSKPVQQNSNLVYGSQQFVQQQQQQILTQKIQPAIAESTFAFTGNNNNNNNQNIFQQPQQQLEQQLQSQPQQVQQQQQQQQQSQPSQQQQQSLYPNTNQYCGDYAAPQAVVNTSFQGLQTAQTPQLTSIGNNMINYQLFPNQQHFQVLGGMPAPMKIEDNQFFLMQRNGYEMPNNQASTNFMPYQTEGNTYNSHQFTSAAQNNSNNLNYLYQGQQQIPLGSQNNSYSQQQQSYSQQQQIQQQQQQQQQQSSNR